MALCRIGIRTGSVGQLEMGVHSIPMVGEKILGAALELLAERGFRGATVRAVAARAGVGAAAIYRRHENREEMMLAAIDDSVGVRQVENTGQTELDLVSMLTVVRESVYAGPGIRVLAAVLLESEEHPELLLRHTVAGQCGQGES